jgi:hypothetical protein
VSFLECPARRGDRGRVASSHRGVPRGVGWRGIKRSVGDALPVPRERPGATRDGTQVSGAVGRDEGREGVAAGAGGHSPFDPQAERALEAPDISPLRGRPAPRRWASLASTGIGLPSAQTRLPGCRAGTAGARVQPAALRARRAIAALSSLAGRTTRPKRQPPGAHGPAGVRARSSRSQAGPQRTPGQPGVTSPAPLTGGPARRYQGADEIGHPYPDSPPRYSRTPRLAAVTGDGLLLPPCSSSFSLSSLKEKKVFARDTRDRDRGPLPGFYRPGPGCRRQGGRLPGTLDRQKRRASHPAGPDAGIRGGRGGYPY